MSEFERPTQRAHREVAAVLREGDLAIDATAGNGHDTLFLAQQVGESGRVVAFDLQEDAIRATRERLESAGVAERVSLVHGSHALLGGQVGKGEAAVAMFNLGYLPGGDHGVITQKEETLKALGQALEVLREGGLLSVICYPGHPGGFEESQAVVMWADGLESWQYWKELICRPGEVWADLTLPTAKLAEKDRDHPDWQLMLESSRRLKVIKGEMLREGGQRPGPFLLLVRKVSSGRSC